MPVTHLLISHAEKHAGIGSYMLGDGYFFSLYVKKVSPNGWPISNVEVGRCITYGTWWETGAKNGTWKIILPHEPTNHCRIPSLSQSLLRILVTPQPSEQGVMRNYDP